MKNLILTSMLLLPALANAQALLNIYCEECRDLTEFPEDARNFSYNQVFGPQSWLTPDQADRFQLTDRFGNTVTIDMNVEFQTNPVMQVIGSLGAHLFELAGACDPLVRSSRPAKATAARNATMAMPKATSRKPR